MSDREGMLTATHARRPYVLMTARPISDDGLVSAVLHLVGQSRAYMHQLEGAVDELKSLHDPRAEPLIEVLRQTLASPARNATLRQVEQTATNLLRSLREGDHTETRE